MSFFRNIFYSLRNYFSPKTVDEALEKKEFFAKVYCITSLCLFAYFMYRLGTKETRPKEDSRLIPESWTKFFEKIPVTITTVPELERRHREKMERKRLSLEDEDGATEENVNTKGVINK